MKIIFVIFALIATGALAYGSMSVLRWAAKQKDPFLEMVAGLVIIACFLICGNVASYLVEYIGVVEKGQRAGNLFLLFFAPAFIGMIARTIKYAYFEKGKRKDLCPGCGAEVRKPKSNYCWYCGAKLLK